MTSATLNWQPVLQASSGKHDCQLCCGSQKWKQVVPNLLCRQNMFNEGRDDGDSVVQWPHKARAAGLSTNYNARKWREMVEESVCSGSVASCVSRVYESKFEPPITKRMGESIPAAHGANHHPRHCTTGTGSEGGRATPYQNIAVPPLGIVTRNMCIARPCGVHHFFRGWCEVVERARYTL